jgi:sugar O-acyltransferase (sialic acid O-acetyltransferase NeuD family)
VQVLILGAGAQGRAILDILRSAGRYKRIGFIDDDEHLRGIQVNGVPVLGDLAYALREANGSVGMIIALGNPVVRLKLAEKVRSHSIALLNAVHPSAVVMPSAIVGEGNMIAANAVIGSNARIGHNTIINTAAVVEHDCVLDHGVSVSAGVQVCGRVTMGSKAFAGTGAIILPRISVGAEAVIAAGSVVTHDVPEKVLVRGAPARVVESLNGGFDWRRVL